MKILIYSAILERLLYIGWVLTKCDWSASALRYLSFICLMVFVIHFFGMLIRPAWSRMEAEIYNSYYLNSKQRKTKKYYKKKKMFNHNKNILVVNGWKFVKMSGWMFGWCYTFTLKLLNGFQWNFTVILLIGIYIRTINL